MKSPDIIKRTYNDVQYGIEFAHMALAQGNTVLPRKIYEESLTNMFFLKGNMNEKQFNVLRDYLESQLSEVYYFELMDSAKKYGADSWLSFERFCDQHPDHEISIRYEEKMDKLKEMIGMLDQSIPFFPEAGI